MQTLNQMLTETVFLEQTGKINTALTELLIAKGGRMKPTSWAEVQRMVRDGTAAKVFSIGDQFTCQRNGVNLVWDVIGIDHDMPADPQFTHSLTLQLHDCFPTAMQFDAPEALYYCETTLAAGTYHFAIDSTEYQFTASEGIAAGSQLILNFTEGTPATVTVSATKGGAVSEGSIAVIAGSGGTALSVNDVSRVRYGSNNYKESALRQWLNSSAAAGSVWLPQSNFDRPPDWAATTAGFMNGMDADFLAVVGKTHITVARNTASDGGGSDSMDDYFFLPSRSELFGGVEVSGIDEGAAYPYYSDYSDLGNTAGTGEDSNRIKYKSGTAQYWWQRTPSSGSGNYVRGVGATGNVTNYNAHTSGGVAPACNII